MVGYRLLIAVVLGLCLMLADSRLAAMAQLRAWLTLVVTPIQWAADLPAQGLGWVSDSLAHRNALLEENRELKAQALRLAERVQRMSAISAENVRLRELLSAAHETDERSILGELIGLDYDPFTQRIVINRGRQDGVYPGQPVIDASGLMGQVISVSAYTSRVLLIADTSHAVPVQVNRNGLRFIAQGTGRPDALKLMHVPETADLEVGDLLVTSGLGGRFPFGHPVATISEIRHDPGEPFLQVLAKPKAHLDRSRYVLLLFHTLKGSDPAELVNPSLEPLAPVDTSIDPDDDPDAAAEAANEEPDNG
ncbi:rod shape-determining protein MreC [Terasakiispira papahanaumokuakeensis]|uniref:Cell shape-determining protein MreC n=1 Tax=Terasakiispira papahanaumokuakeensis TaxID=197479 RepID=A0A1E2V7M3_9GAMM|nr:rod shape-determining protein MreC [Terasakiispira papahanaumokuakeensis]